MVKQGWVAIHRQIQDHWLWGSKPYDRAHAWIDMILLANHENKKFMLGNELVEVKQGSFITSEIKLMERWGWSKAKIRAFLDLLQKDEMIVKKSDRKKTTITIVNYEDYAVLKTTKKPQKNHEETADRPRADTNNNENNVNNENNNIKKERKATSYDAILSQIKNDNLKDLYLEYIKMRKMIKAPMTDRALTMLIQKVNKLEPDNVNRQKILLETAIINNWKSVYPIKEDKKAKAEKRSFATYDREALERILNSDEPETAADNEELKAKAEALKERIKGG